MLTQPELKTRIRELKPLPAICQRLTNLIREAEPDLQGIAKTIAVDPVASGLTLNVANSAYFATTREIGTVRDAVVRLGASAIVGSIVGKLAQNALDGPIDGYQLKRAEFWRHSLIAATAAELSKGFCKAWSPFAYTAGLLHDVGKLLLGRIITPELGADIRVIAAQRHLEFYQAEREVLSTDHGVVGWMMAEHWQLPAEIAESILHHHSPEESDEPLCAVTHIADIVAKRIDGVYSENPQRIKSLKFATNRAGLTLAGFEKLLAATDHVINALP